MGNVVSNQMKGRAAYYCGLPAANDALVLVLLKSGGLEADATLVDYDDLAALLAASNDEADATNYVRKTISASVTVTIDDTNDRVDIDVPDQTFTTLGGATNNAIGKAVFTYDGDTTSGTDANITPVSFHDAVFNTDGTTVVVQIDPVGIIRVT